MPITFDTPAIIQQCAPSIGFNTMQAIVKVESGFQTHAIGYKVAHKNGVYKLTRQPKDKEEAVSWARWMLTNGYRFDAGPAQINSRNFTTYGLTPETVFEPCKNIAAGAAILSDAYQTASRKYGSGQRALLAAISSYNSGNFSTGFQTGYVSKVVAAAGGASSTAVPFSATVPPSPTRLPFKSVGKPAKAASMATVPTGGRVSNNYHDQTNPMTAASEIAAFTNP